MKAKLVKIKTPQLKNIHSVFYYSLLNANYGKVGNYYKIELVVDKHMKPIQIFNSKNKPLFKNLFVIGLFWSLFRFIFLCIVYPIAFLYWLLYDKPKEVIRDIGLENLLFLIFYFGILISGVIFIIK